MFSEKDLRELVNYHAKSSMLSVYLNTDPTIGNADLYRLRLRNMLKSVDLDEDVKRVEQYFNTEYDWLGKSVAIFSNSVDEFFRVYSLAVPVADLINVGVKPNLRPLVSLLDNYGGYGVVLVDKQGARLFHFHLGELKEQDGILGDNVRQSKAGGSAMTGMRGGKSTQDRTMDETVERNMRELVEFATHFFQEKHIRRILLSGTEDNIALFRSYLPKSWQSLIVGTFSVGMTAPHLEVLEKAMEIGHQAEIAREKDLVERLITTFAKHGPAEVGLEPTLKMVSEGRVQMLVVHRGFKKEGFRCPDCGIITTMPDEACAACAEPKQPVEDIVALSVSVVLENNGEIEFVQNNSDLQSVGSIGAFLRSLTETGPPGIFQAA